MEIVPIDQIINSLLNDRIKGINSDIYLHGKSRTLEELNTSLESATEKVMKDYLAGLMFYKLNSPDINLKDPKNIKYLMDIEGIISENEVLRPQYYFHLDTILRKFILEVENIPDLYKLAEIAIKVAQYDGLQEAYISIENQATLLYYDSLIKINENQEEKDSLESTKYLKKFKKLGFDMVLTAEMLSNAVTSFIEDRNKMHYENDYGIEVNVQNDFRMINYLFDSGISEGECEKKLKRCKEFLSKKEKENYRIKDIYFDFRKIEISLFADLKKLKKTGQEILIYSLPGVACFVSPGKYETEEEDVIIKEYRMDANVNDEIKEKIYQEAKCFEYLAKKDIERQGIKNRFFKYKGVFEDRNRNITTLIYENFGETLRDYIEMLRRNNEQLVNRTLMTLIKDMIQIFSELEEYSIYHQNISLLTIFIDKKKLKLKIGDFNSAVIKISEATVDSKGRKFRDVYYWPEIVEESKQKVGKQDVFALGLVILQLARPGVNQELRTGNSYEEIKSNLIQKIEEVGYGKWLVDLLKKMLNFDHSKRSRFSTLTSNLDLVISSTASVSSTSSSISK